MEKTSSDILRTRPHFEILDGLRGVAALAVVTFHFMEMVFSDYSKNFIGHGFLAVDFFFCLSGFVIGYAYDDRMKKIGVVDFFISRLIRLHPLVILGSILGLISFLLDPFGAPFTMQPLKVLSIFICSVFLIPYPAMEERTYNLFSFNAPAWSLFWEYIANIFYAVILYKIARKYLIVCITIAAIILCIVCYRAGDLMGGWGGANFWHGLSRISFSFLAGLLIFRSHWIIKNKMGFMGLAILLMFAFLFPYSSLNFITEPIIVILYFPLLIMLGAGAHLSNALRKICIFSGKISYPLYMTHYAAIWIFAHFYSKYLPDNTSLLFIILFGILFLLLFAYLAMILYDIPLRKYLTARRKAKLVISK